MMRETLAQRKQNKLLVEGTKRFLGPLNPREEKPSGKFIGLELNEYENMQKKHLHAYLKGENYFTYKKKVYPVEFKFIEK